MFSSRLTTTYECGVDAKTESQMHALWATIADGVEKILGSHHDILWALHIKKMDNKLFAHIHVSNSIGVDCAWGEARSHAIRVPVGQVIDDIVIANDLTVSFQDNSDIVKAVAKKLAEYRADWLKKIK